MEHFQGINETERYNNDLLNEIRKTNQLQEETNVLLRELILKINAPTPNKPASKGEKRNEPIGRRQRNGVNNGNTGR